MPEITINEKFLLDTGGWQELKHVLIKAPVYTLSHVVRTDVIENEAAATAAA